MGQIAFVFSGQGAQHPGMAEDFYCGNTEVRDLFEQAEKIRPGITELCFHGDAAVLKQTENTQPCLYLADLAAAIVLQGAGVKPSGLAGFSLGEVPALAFGGAFSYAQGFEITCKRGELMAEASAKQQTSMLAVLKLSNEAVEEICSRYEHVYPVNYNSPGQLVVSGLC
jgi:(acyl-carrier-protein) S-malonyltransferase